MKDANSPDNEEITKRHTGGSPPAGSASIFAMVLAFVAAVSFYDGYLVVRTGDMILDFEKNPVGSYLIRFNHGDPSLFLLVKAAGTVLVLSILGAVHRCSRRLAGPIAFAVVVFQTGLLIFLTDPLSPI